MKKRILLGIVISIIFIFFVLKNIDLKNLAGFIVNGKYLWILPVFITYPLAFAFRSIRWEFLFSPVKKFKTFELFPCLMMGFAANGIFPMRIGEFVRAYIVGKKHNVSKSASMATIVLERITDGVAILILFGISLVFLPEVPPWTKKLFISGIVFFITALVVAVILIVKKNYVDLLKKIPFIKNELKEKIVQKAKKFITGFEIIKDVKSFSMVMFFSLCVWMCESASMYFFVKIVNINLSLFVMIFVLFVTVIGLTIPAAPGSVGTFEFFFVTSMMFFGIGKENALASALIIHSIALVFIMSLGLFYFMKEGISYKEITATS